MASKLATLYDLRNNLDATTWLIIGACLQSLLIFLLPAYIALLPPFLLVTTRAVQKYVLPSNDAGLMKGVHLGRYTTELQLSNDKNETHSSVVVFLIGASSNHPAGRLAPGFPQLGKYFLNMWKEAAANPEKSGFLGKTCAMLGTDAHTASTTVTISYWRSLEDLHAFAQSPVHRVAWDWMSKYVKEYPYLGLYHETYAVPKDQWETVYINMPSFGMGQVKIPKEALVERKRAGKDSFYARAG